MNGLSFNTIMTVLNFIGIGIVASGFVSGKATAVQDNLKPTIELVQMHDKKIAVNEQKILTLEEAVKAIQTDIKETNNTVKEIRQLFYEERGYNKPAAKNSQLITGVSKDGSPR